MYFVVSVIAALTVIKKLSVRASISCFEYYYAIDLGKGVYQVKCSKLPLPRTLGISNISLSRTKCSVPCYESTLN